MLAKMIDKIVALKETKTFEIAGQTYADASISRCRTLRHGDISSHFCL